MLDSKPQRCIVCGVLIVATMSGAVLFHHPHSPHEHRDAPPEPPSRIVDVVSRTTSISAGPIFGKFFTST